MKFIHTADLHLDSPFLGLQTAPDALWQLLQQATFQSFEKLVTAACEQAVDFVCISGDLFDSQAQSIQVQAFLNAQFQRLAAAEIPVYLGYGNHDYVQPQQVQLDFPTNVHIFGEQPTTYHLTTHDQKTVAITGFSYHQRWVTETPKFPSRDTETYHIGMWHGAQRTGQAAQDHYAPFTVADLLHYHYDYWALGHIHKRQTLHKRPFIGYSGDPQGLRRSETGPKGYLLVTEQSGQLQPQFKPTSVIDWQDVTVDVAGAKRMTTLINHITDQLQSLPAQQHYLVRLQLTETEQLTPQLQQRIDNGELLQYLQQQAQADPVWRWPVTLEAQYQPTTAPLQQFDEKYWQTAAQQVFSPENILKTAAPLAGHQFIMDAFTTPEQIATLRNATTKLLQNRAVKDAQKHVD